MQLCEQLTQVSERCTRVSINEINKRDSTHIARDKVKANVRWLKKGFYKASARDRIVDVAVLTLTSMLGIGASQIAALGPGKAQRYVFRWATCVCLFSSSAGFHLV